MSLILSTMGTSSSVGSLGILPISATPSIAFSVPTGTSMNLSFNQIVFPWVKVLIPLLAPGNTNVLATTLTQFVAVLTATINNLLAG